MTNPSYYEPPDEEEEPEDYECPDCLNAICRCPDPDEARDRGRDDPDLFDSRGRLWRDD